MKLWNFIKNHMMDTPNQRICESSAELSFEEAVIWAESFAKRLSGVHCCAILCSSEMACAISLLACFAADVTAVPLSMRYGQSHYNKILDTIGPDGFNMMIANTTKITKIQ